MVHSFTAVNSTRSALAAANLDVALAVYALGVLGVVRLVVLVLALVTGVAVLALTVVKVVRNTGRGELHQAAAPRFAWLLGPLQHVNAVLHTQPARARPVCVCCCTQGLVQIRRSSITASVGSNRASVGVWWRWQPTA